ncbi:MAG TPA: AarF/ABC1/UbiB kinase family protein, partial [Limnobacter sp.]|nr:AarF/ABC1/UbiB kinase family protein [Limnobacter sp.]
MPDHNTPKKSSEESAVPASRLARLSRFGALATTVAGSVVKNGTKQLAMGKRPRLSDLLLTPKNAKRVADQLANLRGAAMKLGQLISMDTGDMLPPQLTEILSRLRQDAKHMPRAQLLTVLQSEWGQDWQSKVREFDLVPMAAASIGQVHRAVSLHGETLAVKIQYPGVRDSINSDIDNVASILKFTGLVPKSFDLTALLSEAKKQLHEEADYLREAECIEQYSRALGVHAAFELPHVDQRLTTSNVLAMRYLEGQPIESLSHAPQAERDQVASHLFELLFLELFHMRLMQTDPNFANYRYNPSTGKVVLLDFGATRAFTKKLVHGYEQVIKAALKEDRAAMEKAARHIGYFDDTTLDHHRELVLDLMALACEPLCTEGGFAFGTTDLALRLRDKGLALAEDR